MRILLDTHALICFLTDSTKIPVAVREQITESENELFFSSVSILEIAIKHSQKPVIMPCPPDEVRLDAIASAITEIPFDSCHARRVGELPWIHKDPFDRMLIAQAMEEGMQLLSHDEDVARYGDFILRF